MKIATRMTLALSFAGLVLFGVYGIYLVWLEERDLRRAVEREVMLLSQSLQVSIENALRDRQVEDIDETIVELERIDPTIRIQVYDVHGNQIASTRAVTSEELVEERVIAESSPRLHYDGDDPEHIIATIPLVLHGEKVGRVVLVRPLTDMQDDLTTTRRGIALSVFIFVLMTLFLGWLLGRVYITNPLDELTAAMRHVRTGDLGQSAVHVGGASEIGELAEEFNEMVGALRQAREELREEGESRRRLSRGLQEADKLITIGQLSAGLAHEIGTPLQVLGGRARLILDNPTDPDHVERNASIINEQVDRITGIVEELLHFARRKPAQATLQDPLPIVRSIVELLEVEARRRHVDLTLKVLHQAIHHVHVDQNQLQQIMLNLVTNALQATPAQGTIQVTLENHLMTRANQDREAVRICVRDTGTGIDPEVGARLFEPFFTTRSARGGTGLGLAIVKALVDEIEGQIQWESQPGGPTTFSVWIPRPRNQEAS